MIWKYCAINAHRTIGLHDCRSNNMRLDGQNLIVDFPDGFWILPNSEYIDHDMPLKTGAAQLCFKNVEIYPIDLFKNVQLLHRTVFCRRIRIELDPFLQMVSDGNHELEFLYEYHRSINCLYQCSLWKKNPCSWMECQFEVTAESIEYRWNEILPDHEW